MFTTNSKILKQAWVIMGGVSVRTKIFGIVLGSTIFLSAFFVYQIRIELYKVLEQKSKEQGVSVARDIAAQATDLILINDLFSLHNLLLKTGNNYPDVRYIFILDAENNILAHTFGDGFPQALIDINRSKQEPFQNIVVLDAGEELIWDVALPIFNGDAGTARVGISNTNALKTLRLLTTRMGIMIVAVILGSLLAATFLTMVLTRPILTLVKATKKIARGDFSPRVDRWANDEIGDLAVSFNQMADELIRMDEIRAERELLRKQVLERVITAQEEERKRISRELHDSTSQSLTSLMIGLRNLSEGCDGEEIRAQIKQLREETSRTLENVHELAVQLRPTTLDDLGLKVAIEWLVNDWRERYKIAADVFVHLSSERLPRNVETVLYRVIQEALTNIAKHARATSASVLIERKNNSVTAIVEDDGTGFDMTSPLNGRQLGLLGMKERVELLHGKFTIESGKERGTSIFISLPILQIKETV